MPDRIDYTALATRIRAAHAGSRDRHDAQAAQRRSEGGVPLDAALRYLDSKDGAQLARAWTDKARTLVAEQAQRRRADPAPPPFDMFGDAYLPQDPLERRVVETLARRMHFGPTEVQAQDIPRVLVTALAGAAGTDGVLDREAVVRRLGAQGGQLLDAITAGLRSFKAGTERPHLKYEGLDIETMRKVAFSAGRRTFAERMPALQDIVALQGRGAPFAGFTMASVQHLFPSTMALYDALEQGGLRRAVTGVGGKSYSANPDVTARMQAAEGWDVAPENDPSALDATGDAEHAVYEAAHGQLAKLFRGVDPKKETKPRFLLLDDGGKLLRCLHEQFPAYVHLCVGVEQTDRGLQVLDEMAKAGIKLGCPVVDMARSPSKKQHEAPMIGEAIVVNALMQLERMHPDLAPATKTATVVGYGAVGRATAQALLRRGYHVVVTDPDSQRAALAKADGCEPLPREDALRAGSLLVSCTGRGAINRCDYALLPDGCVMVNGASGNHELSLHDVPADYFERMDPGARVGADGRMTTRFRGLDVDGGDAWGGDAMLHRVLRDAAGKELLALRSGYVVNMTLGLPPEYVQLVLGLLYASCAQAAREETPGLKPLATLPQDLLVENTRAALAELGHDLDAPDFRGLASWEL